MESLLQIVVCQECEKDYKNIRHGTASHKIAFAIAILDTLIHCEFLLTHYHKLHFLWLPLLPFLKNNLCTRLPFVVL